jgi:hypothetical protein
MLQEFNEKGKIEELSSKQKIGFHAVHVGIDSVGFYYGVKNWKKNGWWKALAVYCGLGIGVSGSAIVKEALAEKKKELEP